MLINFSIENCLSFKDKNTLSLLKTPLKDDHNESIFKAGSESLLKSLVVFGPNASGKSNILKALFFFRNYILNGLQISLETPLTIKQFAFNTSSESKPTTFEIELEFASDKYLYGFSILSNKIVEEWFKSENRNTIFKRKGKDISSSNKAYQKDFKNWVHSTRENVLFISVLASYNWRLAVEFVENIKNINLLLENWDTMDYSFRKYKEDESFRQKMRDLIIESDFGIEDIQCTEKDLTIEDTAKLFPPKFSEILPPNGSMRELWVAHQRFDDKNNFIDKTSLNFFEESKGTRNMFSLAGPIVDTLENGRTLFVDEIDSSLHPMLCRFILKLFNSKETNKKNAQLIFTTHDLSTLDEEYLRRDQIWFTEKDKYGSSKLFSLAELGERKEVSFSKRYLEGRYGAIPYIKTLESEQ